MALAVAGWLANNGIAEQSAISLVRMCSQRAGDRLPEPKVKAVKSTYAKLRAGHRPLGWTALKDHCSEGSIAELDQAMKTVVPRPTIVYSKAAAPKARSDTDDSPLPADEQHLPTVTALAWERVNQLNEQEPLLFLLGDEPTRIDSGEDGAPVPRILTKNTAYAIR